MKPGLQGNPIKLVVSLWNTHKSQAVKEKSDRWMANQPRRVFPVKSTSRVSRTPRMWKSDYHWLTVMQPSPRWPWNITWQVKGTLPRSRNRDGRSNQEPQGTSWGPEQLLLSLTWSSTRELHNWWPTKCDMPIRKIREKWNRPWEGLTEAGWKRNQRCEHMLPLDATHQQSLVRSALGEGVAPTKAELWKTRLPMTTCTERIYPCTYYI